MRLNITNRNYKAVGESVAITTTANGSELSDFCYGCGKSLQCNNRLAVVS